MSAPPLAFERPAGAYLLLQGSAGLAWWIGMAVSPAFRSLFANPGIHLPIHIYAGADLLLFVGGSLLAGVQLWCRRPAAAVCWLTTGATLYALIMCLQGAVLGTGSAFAAVLMMPAAMLTTHIATLINGFPFRVSSHRHPALNVVKAVLQTAVFWAVFFVGIPALILQAQAELQLARFAFPGQGIVAGLGFVGFGVFAWWGTAVFALHGHGTPLPNDAPAELVVTGPYRWVRNPMAVGGIAQGLWLGFGLGSWPVMLYCLVGAAIWHLGVRPIEEADLLARFGAPYEAYRKQVRCWWPRFRRQGEAEPG